MALAQVLRDKALTEQIDENIELQEDIARLTRVEIRRDCYLSTDMSSYAHGNFNDRKFSMPSDNILGTHLWKAKLLSEMDISLDLMFRANDEEEMMLSVFLGGTVQSTTSIEGPYTLVRGDAEKKLMVRMKTDDRIVWVGLRVDGVSDIVLKGRAPLDYNDNGYLDQVHHDQR